MKIYDSLGPNPRALRFYLLEKGLDVPLAPVDLMGAENRREPYVTKNPGGQIPSLELDDGRVLGETVAIYEYFEEKHPAPPLIGTTADERAETRQWQRRIELRITENLYNGFRFAEGLPIFESRMRCLPEAAPGLKAVAQDNLRWLDAQLEGKDWIVGDRFTIADISLFVALDFGASVGQPMPDDAPRVRAWFDRVSSRPGAAASLHDASEQAGIRG